MKEVTVIKKNRGKPNYTKEPINWVSVFENWRDENGLEINPETVRPEQLESTRAVSCLCV